VVLLLFYQNLTAKKLLQQFKFSRIDLIIYLKPSP